MMLKQSTLNALVVALLVICNMALVSSQPRGVSQGSLGVRGRRLQDMGGMDGGMDGGMNKEDDDMGGKCLLYPI